MLSVKQAAFSGVSGKVTRAIGTSWGHGLYGRQVLALVALTGPRSYPGMTARMITTDATSAGKNVLSRQTLEILRIPSQKKPGTDKGQTRDNKKAAVPEKDVADRALRALRRHLQQSTGALSTFRLQQATHEPDTATVALTFDGLSRPVRASTLWLRDSCRCAQCVAPSSGQKHIQTTDLPDYPAIQHVEAVPISSNGDDSDGSSAEGTAGRNSSALRIEWATLERAGSAGTVPHVSTYPDTQLLLDLAALNGSEAIVLPRVRLWDRALLAEDGNTTELGVVGAVGAVGADEHEEATIVKAGGGLLRPVAFDDWMAGGAAFYRGLLDLYQLGILVVEGVPETVDRVAPTTTPTSTDSAVPGVRAVAEQIGHVQSTFYGDVFDVVAKPAAENVAYTSDTLCLHQDLLYMAEPPYIQLLHCLHGAATGGASLFSDGLRVALELQVRGDPAMRLLRTVPVRYHYERNGHAYYHARPVIEDHPDAHGGIKQTAWSPPFQDHFGVGGVFNVMPKAWYAEWQKRKADSDIDSDSDGRADSIATPPSPLHQWRAGAQRFAALAAHPDNVFEITLQPGQCVLFNNRRVLHGRRAFDLAGGGTRHLQGTYLAEQTFLSRVRGMVREGHLPDDTWGTTAAGPVDRPSSVLLPGQQRLQEWLQVKGLLRLRGKWGEAEKEAWLRIQGKAAKEGDRGVSLGTR